MRAWSSRERHLAIMTAALVATWLVVSWVVLPLWDRLSLLHQQGGGSEEKLARLQTLLHHRGDIERQYQQYTAYFSRDPDEVLHSAFLDELEELAGAEGLQINLKPQSVERDDRLNRVTVELDVDGTQEAILGFLERLLTAPQLMEVERFRVSTTASVDRPVQASVVVTKLVLRHASSK